MSGPESAHAALPWLWYAVEDLILAENISRQRLSGERHVCWLAQQAAEKAIKAILVFEGILFPKTHDLPLLRDLVPAGWMAAAPRKGLGRLSIFAIEARYPGDWEEASAEDTAHALDLARSTVIAAREGLLDRGLADVAGLPALPGEIR